MIDLTRLNNQPLTLNADLIKYIEQAPDTVITLVTGEKLVVKESAEEVIRRVIGFRKMLLTDLYRRPLPEERVSSDCKKQDPES